MSGTVDLYLDAGGDLLLSPSGDIQTVADPLKTQQRIIRRLLTNLGGYIWNPLYGAGLPQFIGQPIAVPTITAIVQAQIALESTVAQNPAPVVTVTSQPTGVVTVSIVYTDAATGQSSTLTFPLG